MSTQKLITLCFATVFALGLAACGGGGGDAPVADMMDNGDTDDTDDTSSLVGKIFPDGTVVQLPPDSTGDATLTFMAEEGASLTVPDVGTFECVTGPCMVVAANDELTSTGVIKVVSLADDIPAVILAALEAKAEDEPAAPTVAELFATAQDARDDATSAGTSASDAVKAAGEANDELGTMNAAGESMTEFTNAQAIMDAQADAVQAVMDAQAALDSATEAKTAAEGLDADNEHKSALIAALDAAIIVAEEQLEAATESRDSDDLKTAVDAVTGGDDADPQGTPGSRAKAVAMAVGEALGGMTTDAGIPRATITSTLPDVPAATANMTVVRMDDHQGKTWAEIVGETSKKRIGTSVANTTNEVDAASIAGMTLASTQAATADEMVEDNGLQVSATYKGIMGTAFCQGSDCKVETVADNADVRKFTGSWYFTPESPMAFYMKGTDDEATMDVDESKSYVPETLYAQFGHWLAVDATTGVVTINRYALTGGNTADLEFDKVDDMPDSATYNGDAAGMSVHKTTDEDGVVTSIYSGAFTADAELLLRFGDGVDMTLGGTIDGFEGNAVDPKWTVELERRVFTGNGEGTGNQGSFAETPGKTVASGRDGEWSATAYGPGQVVNVDQRPTGIFGAFNAHFSDGHAAGAYATR